MEGEDRFEKRFDRQTLLKLAAAPAARDWSPGARASRRHAHVLDRRDRALAGDRLGRHRNDGGQSMFAQYVKQHAANKPQFTYMTNESDALAKIRTLAEEIAADPKYDDEGPLGPDEETRARFRAFARDHLGS